MSRTWIACLGGTGADERDGEQRSEHRADSVFRIFAAAADRGRGRGQHARYFRGVGNEIDSRGLRRLAQQVFGAGVRRQVDRAYRWLSDSYQAGDRIILVGASRGADAASRLWRRIWREGLGEVEGAAVDVALAVLFDRVQVDWTPVPLVERLARTSVPPANVRRVLHLVALDETRRVFGPRLLRSRAQDLEVWCLGDHRDVCGGWRDGAIGDIALGAAIGALERRGVLLGDLRKQLRPDPAGAIHRARRPWLRRRRRCRALSGGKPVVHRSVLHRRERVDGWEPAAEMPADVRYWPLEYETSLEVTE